MRTLFEVGWQKETWNKKLGVTGSSFGFGDLISAGTDVTKAYLEQQKAEEQRKAAEAAAKAAQASAAVAAYTSQPGTTFGIPNSYLIVGGVGLAIVALVVGISASKG